MAAVGSSVEPKTLVDAQPLLQPLTHNWATGARLEFLNSYIEDYKSALTHPNREACSDLIDKIVNAWFAKFHWSLTVKEDPAIVKPRVPLSEGGFEHLSAEDSTTKGKVIERMRNSLTNWFDRRTKRTKKNHAKSAATDHTTVLLNRLLGIDSGPPKLTPGWAVWGKANFASMKVAFDKAFEAGGKPESRRASECNRYKKQQFKKLSEDDQIFWNDKAREDHQLVKEAYKYRKENLPELLPPKEAQLALNEMLNVLGPFIQGLGQALGMHITVLLGGPEPKKKGVLNVISLHQGLNKAPVPKPWGVADKDGCKIVTAQFLEFLKTCYSPEEQRACAIDESDVVAPSTGPAASTTNINVDGASALGSVSTSATTGVKGKRKRKRSEKGLAKPQKKQTKKKKHHNVSDEELDTDDNNKVEDSDEEDTESSSEEELTDNEEEEDLPTTRSRKGTQGTTMDPSRFIETGVKSPANGNDDVASSIWLPDLAAVDWWLPLLSLNMV